MYGESVQTQWVINNLSRGLQGHRGGDASMGPLGADLGGGQLYYNRYNAETGLTWLNRLPQPL